ncbi:unnamed protein product [Clonostachys byssicola]|uniref:Cytochrome P450 n=1 Tax=Clonostachys byssicola TaxID=160290 RepID=A0A9N9UNB7_9HYPO|nr:unnamed protein product [Clonostachys byssicola]
MTPLFAIFAVVAALTSAALYNAVYNLFLSPLSKIPAPHWSCHFSKLWFSYVRLTRQENKVVYRKHMEKGRALRLAPGVLSLNAFEDGLKPVYLGGFPKTEFYSRAFNNYDTFNIFTFPDNATHSARKRMISNTFSKSFILNSATTRSSVRNILFGRLLPIIEDAARNGKPLDMLDLSYAYSMDSFIQWQFGKRLGSNFIQDLGERRFYLDGFFAAAPYTFWLYEFPTLNKLLKKVGLIPSKVDSGLQDVEDWNLEKCDSAYKLLESGEALDDDDNPIVFSHAVKKMIGDDPMPATKGDYPLRLDIASDMFSHNGAAHETSGNTLGFLYYEMSRRPDVQKKLRSELLTLTPPLKFPQHLSEGQELDIPLPKDVDALPYLEAVIMETLRLYPPVPGAQPRTVPEPCSLGGYDEIPAGTTVQSYAYSLHRTPEVFPDPETWNPDRWVNASPAELSNMRRWFWAFGSGGRMCIGSNFAWFSMKHNVGSIYTNYTSSVHSVGSMELMDAYLAGPKGHKVEIQFSRVQ